MCLLPRHSLTNGGAPSSTPRIMLLWAFTHDTTDQAWGSPFFFGPLQTTASSLLCRRNPMDMTANLFSLSAYTGTHLRAHDTVGEHTWPPYALYLNPVERRWMCTGNTVYVGSNFGRPIFHKWPLQTVTRALTLHTSTSKGVSDSVKATQSDFHKLQWLPPLKGHRLG